MEKNTCFLREKKEDVDLFEWGNILSLDIVLSKFQMKLEGGLMIYLSFGIRWVSHLHRKNITRSAFFFGILAQNHRHETKHGSNVDVVYELVDSPRPFPTRYASLVNENHQPKHGELHSPCYAEL